MFRITYLTHLILALVITASKSIPQKGPTPVSVGKNGRRYPGCKGCCTVAINDEEILLIGYSGDISARVLKYNVKTNQGTQMPDLKIGRNSTHGCALFKGGSKGDYVIVTGGITWENYSNTTEIYYIQSGESEIVGDLNQGRNRLSLVTVESPRRAVYAMGGQCCTICRSEFAGEIKCYPQPQDTVELWDDISKTWKVTKIKLKKPNFQPASLAVARDMICSN